jgi:GNAT superfamily N-acetyltransferase
MIIRPLTVFEREAVKRLYLSLSDEDRRMRFCATASDETICKYVAGLDYTRTTILGAFDEHAQIIGLAELARGEHDSEMAFAVRAEMRGRKIGTRLMEKMLVTARMSGARTVMVMFLSENTPMRRLAARVGMKIRAEGTEAYASLALEAPAAAELTRWYMEEGFAHGEYFSALASARWGSIFKDSLTAGPNRFADPLNGPSLPEQDNASPSLVRAVRTGSDRHTLA